MEKGERMIEEWRDIAGWEGAYQVSNLGRVRSVDRVVVRRNGARFTVKGRVMKTHFEGRLKRKCVPIFLSDATGGLFGVAGRKVWVAAAHLVLTAFVGPAPDTRYIAHKRDGDCGNLRLDNLEWRRKPQLRLSDDNVREIRAARGQKTRKLAAKFGVSMRAVRRVRSGDTHRFVSRAA